MSNTASGAGVASAKLPFSRVRLAGLIAIVGSVIANLIVYWLGGMIAQPPADFMPLASPGPTIIFTTGFLVIATAIYAVINAFARNPVRVWTIVAWVALLVGLIPDLLLLINPAAMGMGTPSAGSSVPTPAA